MPISLEDLSASPALYPLKLDPVRDSVLLIRLSDVEYKDASFLDDRVLTPATDGAWAPFGAVAERASRLTADLPLHFIFHAGHVGSTLLSRVLDATGEVLGLREPLPLRTLADAGDVLGTPQSFLDTRGFDLRLTTFLRLWRRGFATTKTVVVKATSAAARLHPVLLERVADSRAVYLNLRPEPYLATLLAGENTLLDLRGHGPERIARLLPVLADDTPRLHDVSPGELAAASWLAERLCQEQATARFADRLLAVDFDDLLANTETTIGRVLEHFSIQAPDRFVQGVRGLPVFSRYAKAPDQFPYSPELRARILAEARTAQAAEIANGLRLLERLGARHSAVAKLL